MNRRRVLQHRIMLENMCHGDSVFLTLTYEDLQLVYNVKCRLPELVPRHLMLFMKRLREAVSPVKIRFYGVGEYGDISERPHLVDHRAARYRCTLRTEQALETEPLASATGRY